MGCVVTGSGRETAGSVRFGVVAPCVGGVRAASGPHRVLRRSARRLGRAGCRRGGGEGPGWVAGIGRGTGPPTFPIGAPTATAPALGGLLPNFRPPATPCDTVAARGPVPPY